MPIYVKNLFSLALLSCIVSFAGCTKQSERPADKAAHEQIFLVGMPGEPESMDPHLFFSNASSAIAGCLFEGLVWQHPQEDTEVLPGVAYRWETSQDGLRWTFYLRTEARWSNGDAVTAHDFVASYERELNPKLGSRFAEMLFVMENAQAYHAQQITDFSQVGVKALSDHTLEFTLAHPTPYFLLSLAQYFWYPLHIPTIQKHGGIHNPQASWAVPGRCVCNGPFIITRWSPWEIIELKPNPRYWNAQAVKLRGLKFYPFEEHHTEHRAFLAGQIHYVSRPAMDYIDQFKKDYPEALHIDEYLSTYYYRLNVKRPPLDDVRVRMALNLAVDRQAIVEKITRGGENAAVRFVPKPFVDYAGPEGICYNPERARELLAEAGYPAGKGLPEIELLYNTSSNHKAIAEAVQSMWARELGIQCRLYNQEWRVYLGTLGREDYEIARSQWIALFADPMSFLEIFETNNANNQTGWSSPQYDALLRAANFERDPQKRSQIMAKAEALLMQEVPIVPIFWNTRTYLLDPRIRGWHPKLADCRPYHTLWFECD